MQKMTISHRGSYLNIEFHVIVVIASNAWKSRRTRFSNCPNTVYLNVIFFSVVHSARLCDASCGTDMTTSRRRWVAMIRIPAQLTCDDTIVRFIMSNSCQHFVGRATRPIPVSCKLLRIRPTQIRPLCSIQLKRIGMSKYNMPSSPEFEPRLYPHLLLFLSHGIPTQAYSTM